jgi:hypothetical protein
MPVHRADKVLSRAWPIEAYDKGRVIPAAHLEHVVAEAGAEA